MKNLVINDNTKNTLIAAGIVLAAPIVYRTTKRIVKRNKTVTVVTKDVLVVTADQCFPNAHAC